MDTYPYLLVTEFLINGDMQVYLRKPDAQINLSFDKLILISANVSSDIKQRTPITKFQLIILMFSNQTN